MTQNAPIVVFGYNRPDHLKQTLSHLSKALGARDSDLWIFCDGPNPNADLEKIIAVRTEARDPVWATLFRSVTVEISDENKGLASSIIGGVTKAMSEAGRAIVVEDDLLVSPDFITFMNDCLDFYEDNAAVGSVTGFSPLSERPSGYSADVVAVPRNCSHGWATWADRWAQVDWEAKDARKIWRDAGLRRRFNAAGNDRADRLRRQLAGKIDSWSIRFGLWQTLSGRHTIYPVQNRVRNIGFDGSGVHTRSGQEVNAEAAIEACAYTLENVTQDPTVIRTIAKVYSGPWARRTIRSIRTWLRFQTS